MTTTAVPGNEVLATGNTVDDLRRIATRMREHEHHRSGDDSDRYCTGLNELAVAKLVSHWRELLEALDVESERADSAEEKLAQVLRELDQVQAHNFTIDQSLTAALRKARDLRADKRDLELELEEAQERYADVARHVNGGE